MKGSEHFKETIKAYLDHRASYDELFAHNYSHPLKSLDDCVTYVLNWVKKSGCCGFGDMEIYSQCIHYYDELDIEIGDQIKCDIVVNHAVELTEEEKAQARRDAIQKVQDQYYATLSQPKASKPRVAPKPKPQVTRKPITMSASTLSLFD